MTHSNFTFKKFTKKIKALVSNTPEIQDTLSSHLFEAILTVLNKKQVINDDNKKEIGDIAHKAADKLAKNIVKGKISSETQIAEMLEKTADDITSTSGANTAEGENSRGIGLVAVTTAVTTLNNSPLAQSMAKAVMKKLTSLTLDTLDNLPLVQNIIEKMQDSDIAMGVIHKASSIDLPGALGDATEGAIDGVEEYLAGHTATPAA